MQRHAIIHIGTMKTGSTSIQNVFNKRRAEILAQGACYPRTPGAAAHVLLTYAVGRPRPERGRGAAIWNGMEPTDRLAQFRVEFAQEMENLPLSVDRVIFSDERMSFGLREEKEVASLRQLLSPYFSKFTIIAYLRRQDSLLASRYSELLRVGSVGEPDHIRNMPSVMRDYDFGALLRLWASVFGESAIKPRLYERGGSRQFDSVDDFIGACGLNIIVPPDDPARGSNPSMNAAGQEVLREVGRLLQERMGAKSVSSPLWRNISTAVTRALPGKGWLPTRDEAAAFMARFAESNEEVRSLYFPDRVALFADEAAHFPMAAPVLSDRQRFEAACQALVDSTLRAAAGHGPASDAKAKPATRPAGAKRAALEVAGAVIVRT